MGIGAWNLALLPEEEREAALREFRKAYGGTETAGPADLDEIINWLIRRKQREFASVRRVIVVHRITFSSGQLMVMATPLDDEQNK